MIGNRPQFIKAAAVSPLLRAEHTEVMVHTGQHFDDELSSVFFTELGLPAPERELKVSLGSNTSQTSRMLAALEPVIDEERPDVVLVYGDTNSTLAGAIAGAQARVPVAHVEAGMRSFDRAMPEELNRVLTDHASALLRRRRDGRRRAEGAAERAGAGGPRARARTRAGRVRVRDRPPRRQRR